MRGGELAPLKHFCAATASTFALLITMSKSTVLTACPEVSFRRISADCGSGGQAFKKELHDLRKPAQSFRSLYRAVVDAVHACGACSRSDLALIPAFSSYSHWQLERALETARLHGYLKTVGRIPAAHPDAPQTDEVDAPWPLVYNIDPAGPLLDRTDTQRLVQRAISARSHLEIRWIGA